ncbi:hypothetical protein [Kibdelosporangium philippinense]|uniref:hypothetical protein n=1 Tax=Kibdelosporangium philippinense TaxID=211113 RepID=UPI00360C672C
MHHGHGGGVECENLSRQPLGQGSQAGACLTNVGAVGAPPPFPPSPPPGAVVSTEVVYDVSAGWRRGVSIRDGHRVILSSTDQGTQRKDHHDGRSRGYRPDRLVG